MDFLREIFMKLKFAILAAAATPLVAWAVPPMPMKTTACGERTHVRPPRGGAGVFFDDTCQTAYVLPPAYGTFEMSGSVPTVSPEDCTELAALGAERAALAERLKRVSQPRRGSDSGGSTIGGGGSIGGGTIGGGGRQPEPEDPEQLERIKKESEEIRAEFTRIRDAEKVFTAMEGLVSKVIYTLDHEGMVAEYKRLNPALNFVRLQPEIAYMTIAAKGEDLKNSASEVLDYDVPGLAKLPDEEGEAPANTVYFGTALSGKVRLNAKAACIMMKKYGNRIPETLPASQFERHMSANITYAYGLGVRRSYYAKYDFQKLFEHIAKQTQTGGFLSTKSVNEVIQRNESNSWFTFRAASDDTRYPNEVLAQQLKAEMIDRVMAQIAIGTVPGAGTIPAPLTPGPKGADVAADGLKKCPYVYCQVAGYVLDFVSATFGSSQAVAKFLSTVGSSSEERVDEQRTLRFRGTSTFKDRL